MFEPSKLPIKFQIGESKVGNKGKVETLLAQAGHYLDRDTGAVVPPIQPSTTFARDEEGDLYDGNRIYARDHSFNAEMAEAILCELEGGVSCKIFASGRSSPKLSVNSPFRIGIDFKY